VTIHLVYPHGTRISTPDAIGRKLSEKLSEKYDVKLYDWDEKTTIIPDAGDILIGHPHPGNNTVLRNSIRNDAWKRKILLCPFAPNSRQVAFIDAIIPYCDKYLAITGEYWFSQIKNSVFSHWLPKMAHMDLAVDRKDFPLVKTTFNPAGKRKFIYIGSQVWFKNISYLSMLAGKIPETEFAWIGKGSNIRNLVTLGARDFSHPDALEIIKNYDFMITVGVADANPTTILEAMAWGLIPVCTKESGYSSVESIINIPLNNIKSAIEILEKLNFMPADELLQRQNANITLLDEHFNWDRFSKTVIDEIENDDSPPVGPEKIAKKFYFMQRALTSKFQTSFNSKIYIPVKERLKKKT